MHGLVNRAIQELVVSEHGHVAWGRIVLSAGWEGGEFVSMEQYDDDLTLALVHAACEELGKSAQEFLEELGGYWMRFSVQEGYGPLLDMVGETFEEFLERLDDMHTRVGLSLPGLRPPSFNLRRTAPGVWDLHYLSHRRGFGPMVVGIMHALAERFGMRIAVTSSEQDETLEGGASLFFHIREIQGRGRSAA